MTAKITNNFNAFVAKAVRDNLKDINNLDAYYAFVSFNNDSDIQRYMDSDGIDEDAEFTGGINPTFNSDDKSYYMQHAISAHKLQKGNITRVVPRVNWLIGTKYKVNNYVMVTSVIRGITNLNVYKVLHEPNSPSLSPPSGDQSTPITTSDKYVWQYMYTINSSDSLRFVTETFIPIPERIEDNEIENLNIGTSKYKQYQVQRDSSVGTIYNVTINDSDWEVWARNSYGSFSSIPISINLTVQNSTSNVPSKIFSGSIEKHDSEFSFSLINYGEGYSEGSIVKIGSNTPSGLTTDVSPGLGHGTNVPLELNSNSVMINIRNVPDEDVVKFSRNDFRMVSLLRNPIDNSTNKIAKNDFYTACKSFIGSDSDGGNTTFNIGDIVATADIAGNNFDSTTAKVGRIVAVDVSKKEYFYVNLGKVKDKDTFVVDDEIKIVTTSGTVSGNPLTISKINNRQILYNSGDILLTDIKNTKIRRAKDQIESFNFILTL
tara:strand:+ start:18415 stop:19881 length:1467 start_codon:yes stop_codon:yes gene_type:complete